MNTCKRTLTDSIEKDLCDKMVFITGPRQVGKTTLAKSLLKKRLGLYLNWDAADDRSDILHCRWPEGNALVVLDEIHKYRRWKRFIKGEYDKYRERLSFLVTGSARLDIYRRGSDSLLGRYHRYRLHPFSVAELAGLFALPQPGKEIALRQEQPVAFDTGRLLNFGGFPELYLKNDMRAVRRWHRERFELVTREDIRDISQVHDISLIQVLAGMLPARAGSLLSLNGLREDLEVSHRAVSSWMNLLESVYYCYRIYPFRSRRERALKKEPKLYLWDWSSVPDPAARFENMIAGHLLKFCHALEDVDGWNAQLWYIRDIDKREVDFLVTIDGSPWFCVEVKSSETDKNHVRYFMERLNIPYGYVVTLSGERSWRQNTVVHVPAVQFLLSLGV